MASSGRKRSLSGPCRLYKYYQSYVSDCYNVKPSPDVLKSAKMACVNYNLSLK